MFRKILIANRGEIAVRVIRACREMGIRSVAVFSEADRQALHVRMADEAVAIGRAPASESYLSIPKIVSAARDAGAEAIHPGYGFLSENPQFAQGVRDAGITFVGPRPDAIHVMGDKVQARALMQSRGVPVVPGYQDADDDASLARAADRIGYPVLIKAAAGGGGKAMRIVQSAAELGEMVAAAHREAQNAFGDPRLFLEKYIANGRHIEFQVIADRLGNTLHLFERECSIQRRHQKIIEETPSPLLDDDLRQRMGMAAVEAARAVNYENAGTIEFIVDPTTREFYFLEMNTRLQVEHPITELLTGLDLVHWQIRIAAGELMPLTQSQITARGHSIEVRIYAEDPARQFLPSTGCLLHVAEAQGPGIRVDSGVTTGDEVTVHYDPMLAKLIVGAEDRGQAIGRIRRALDDYTILGVATNVEFLQAVLDHPTFRSGQATTTFVDQHMSQWQPQMGALLPQVLLTAALSELDERVRAPEAQSGGSDPYSPWQSSHGFRIGS